MNATLSDEAIAVLAALTRAADEGRICPTNIELGVLIGSGVSHASRIVSEIEAAGLIAVERGPRFRAVTIVATGKRTAGVVRGQHWSANYARPGPRPRSRMAAPQPGKAWCDQCELRVAAVDVRRCGSMFCRARSLLADEREGVAA